MLVLYYPYVSSKLLESSLSAYNSGSILVKIFSKVGLVWFLPHIIQPWFECFHWPLLRPLIWHRKCSMRGSTARYSKSLDDLIVFVWKWTAINESTIHNQSIDSFSFHWLPFTRMSCKQNKSFCLVGVMPSKPELVSDRSRVSPSGIFKWLKLRVTDLNWPQLALTDRLWVYCLHSFNKTLRFDVLIDSFGDRSQMFSTEFVCERLQSIFN